MRAFVASALLVATIATVISTGDDDPIGSGSIIGGTTGSEVKLEATQTIPRSQAGPPISYPYDQVPVVEALPERSPRSVELEQCLREWDDIRSCYLATADEIPTEPSEQAATPGLPAITITDVASFAPAGAPLSAEPNSLGIAGLPVNFVTGATSQDVAGSLFSFPVNVRFAPQSFDLHVGDGTVITTTTGGSTWEQLGQAQFTPTPTSHTYTERGTYEAHVEVHYSAEVDLGTGWIPLTGTVTSVGPVQQIRIFEAHTALVAHTCAERPQSPGC